MMDNDVEAKARGLPARGTNVGLDGSCGSEEAAGRPASPAASRPTSLFFAPEHMWMPADRRQQHEQLVQEQAISGTLARASVTAPDAASSGSSSDDSFVSADSRTDSEDEGQAPSVPGHTPLRTTSAWECISPFESPSAIHQQQEHVCSVPMPQRNEEKTSFRTMQSATEVLTTAHGAGDDGSETCSGTQSHAPHSTSSPTSRERSSDTVGDNHNPVSPIENTSSVQGFSPDTSWMEFTVDQQGARLALKSAPAMRLADRIKNCFETFGPFTPREREVDVVSDRQEVSIPACHVAITAADGRLWDPYTPLKPKPQALAQVDALTFLVCIPCLSVHALSNPHPSPLQASHTFVEQAGSSSTSPNIWSQRSIT